MAGSRMCTADDRDHTRVQYEQSLAARENCSIEYRLRRSDGEYRHVICNGVPRFESGWRLRRLHRQLSWT